MQTEFALDQLFTPQQTSEIAASMSVTPDSCNYFDKD